MKIQWQKIEPTPHELPFQNPTTQGDLTSEYQLQTIADPRDDGKPASPKVESVSVQQGDAKKTPALPELESINFSSNGNAANIYIVMNLLRDIKTTVSGWQQELLQIEQQIEEIYQEGPIIEGWLESQSSLASSQSAGEQGGKFPEQRETGKTRDLKERILQLKAQNLKLINQANLQSPDPNLQSQNPEQVTGYRLVGRDRDGKLWSRPCPPEELPTVSLALGRYQKIRHLLSRKEQLETRLAELAQSLVVLQGRLQTL